MLQSNGRRQHSETCRNCGAALHGEFCSQCGQAEHEGHPPTVRHFLHELLHELEHVDGKIFRTLKLLLFRPGALTAEYRAGRVVSYVRPIRLFLIAAAMQLLISAGVGPLNFTVYLERPTGGGELNVIIGPDSHIGAGKFGRQPVSEEERREYEEKFNHAYLTIRYSSVLAFALVSWLLYRRQQEWFVSHIVAGLHFYAFWYLAAAVAGIGSHWFRAINQLSLLAVVYLYFTLRRLYSEGVGKSLGKTVILFAAMIVTDDALAFAAAQWVEKVNGIH